jgi:RNA polymerase sigma-70 factor (ECF subfamily)
LSGWELFLALAGISNSCRTSWREAIEAYDQDEALLRRSAKGDEQAFRLLYGRHQAPIYRFVVRMTGSTWAAEEILQDVFMILLREPKKFDVTRGSLAAYLFGIARNRVMKHFERLPREMQLPEHGENGVVTLAEPVDHRTPAHWAELQERREQVRAAVLGLPVEFRETVVLCELEEMSYEEAAHVLQCPVGTIRSRLHRGRALLLTKLELLRGAPKRVGATR